MTMTEDAAPHSAAPAARFTPAAGRVTAVLGPTNTGKTHLAIERMLGHESGMIGLPLRLLAREVYDRIVAIKGERNVALITGEEKIVPETAAYLVCTVESMPLDRQVAFLAVDEIQLCSDPERGHVFTDRLLHARGTAETLFLGAETMRGLIRALLPDTTFQTRTRFSELTHAGPKKISRLQRRSAVVAFSAEAVYGLAEVIRRQRGGAAVVMGALSPRTRNAQVELYQSGDVDYLVATDAIGMGLNMDVDHVALASLRKFDGVSMRPLRAAEIGQIAGRAGRYMNDGTFGTTADAADLDAEIVDQVESHRFDPVRVAQWRNRDLDFSNLDRLVETLEMPPPVKGLTRTRAATDQVALRLMSEDPVIAASLEAERDLQALWGVCQIPDFRNITAEEHVRLLITIYKHLLDHDGQLPEDWLAGHLTRLDNVEGDLDTLATRIAHVRTWTFVTNRSQWLKDAAHWQDKARAIEDRLSDGLHEGLTQRFIDRRTSVLMKSLRLKDDLMSEISADGEVTVEGHYVGRLQGFQFVADPRAHGTEGKALRSAATKALNSMITARAAQIAGAPDTALELSDHGRIWWQGDPVARLAPGVDGLSPKIILLADDHLQGVEREAVQKRLERWFDAHVRKILGALMDLRDAVSERVPAPVPVNGAAPAATNAAEPDEPAQAGTTGDAPAETEASGSPAPEVEAPTAEAPLAEASDAGAEQAASEDAAGQDGDGKDAEASEADAPKAEGAAPVEVGADTSEGKAEDTAEPSSDPVAAGPQPPTAQPPAAQAAAAQSPVAMNRMVGGVAPLTGLARGIGYQLVESLGALDRRDVAEQVKDLDQAGRAALRRFGVRFGQFSIFFPALLKPAPARLLVTLWAVQDDRFADMRHAERSEDKGESEETPRPKNPSAAPPALPAPGLCSVPVDANGSKGFYSAAGFRVCGPRAVRVDMLERLGDMIRTARDGAKDTQKSSGKKQSAQAKPEPDTTASLPPSPEAPEAEGKDAGAEASAAVEPSQAGLTDGASPEAAPVATGESEVTASTEAVTEDTSTNESVSDGALARDPAQEDAAADGASATEVSPQEPAPVAAEAPEREAPDPKTPEREVPAEPPARPAVPAGSFVITPDMMSIVGCSGEEFEGILKALAFRSQTLRADDPAGEDLVVWRPGGRRDQRAKGGPQRREGGRRPANGQRGQPANGAREGDGAGRGDRRAQGRSGGENRTEESRPNGKGNGPNGKANGKGGNQNARRGKPQNRQGGDRPGGDRRGGERRGGAQQWTAEPPGKVARGGKGGRSKDKPVDPDSPFAVLAALKQGGKDS